MKRNHTKMIGANENPTLSVPNRCIQNRPTKIAIAIPTTASEKTRMKNEIRTLERNCDQREKMVRH